MDSVLQVWVMELPLRAQGTLLTGVRGCDLAPKNPISIDERYGCSTGECTPERQLSAFLRWCILVPADVRELDVPGGWVSPIVPQFKPSQLGHYPQHWYSHIMHCYEVVGYCHPVEGVRRDTFNIYRRLVHNLHLECESKEAMFTRLTEDRFTTGHVVS